MKTLPSPEQIDAVILDFGGVLFDIDYPAPARALQSLGLQDFEALYSKAQQSDLFDRLETGQISNLDFLVSVQALFPADAGVGLDAIREAWNSILIGIPKERVDALYQLKEHFPLYLLSNTNAIHVEAFEQMLDDTVSLAHFQNAFVATHYSNVLGQRKPHPETFLYVCSLHGLEPSRTLFVDDSPQHVEGAKKAGLHGYHLEVDREDIRGVIQRLVG